MNKYMGKGIALALAVVMAISGVSPVSLAAPAEKSSKASVSEEIVLSDNTKAIIEAAKAMASVNELSKEEKKEVSVEKEAVKNGIFHNHEEETNLAGYDITSEEMDKIVDEVLEENHLETTVDVTYETDKKDKVTSMSVEMDAMVAMVGEEAAGLTAEQREELMAKYSQYMSFMQANADLFGVQTPYHTNKDKICPIGSLLAIAGIPNEYLAYGIDFIVQYIMPYDEVSGVIDLFHYANVFTVELKRGQIEAARDAALSAVSGAKTDVQKHLELTNWLAQNCTFDMPYIMKMQAPELDTNSAMYKDKMTIYYGMYENIKGQVYDGYYQYLFYMEGYPEETAKQVAEMMAKSYMDDPTTDGSPNGSESAMTLASSIINLWEGSHVGALTYGTAVCLGYSNAYVYLVQNLYSNVYKNSNGTWKTYEQLNNGSDGKWNAIVDYVRITFDAEVTMFGVTQENFQSDHYWNAVKINNKWYYVDPCYVDVFVEVMARDRVETNGNVNHLYFLFSDDTARELYDGYYKELDTLYEGIATEKNFEDAWFAFAKSPIYKNEESYYYVYDSTDMIQLQQDNTQISLDDIEYKIVSKNIENSNYGDANVDYSKELINFTKGRVYNPVKNRMEANPLIKKYYEEFRSYKEDYPSLVISVAYYEGKLYFNMSNCIFSYDLTTGDVQRLIEYNKVIAERDMTVAFGGMSFTASDKEGDYGITVKNPPIAGMTIRDGEMTVDIATTYGYISGKKSHTDSPDEPEDASSYGYMFEETHYNQEYLYASFSEMGSLMGDTENDNDEFMWSANIYETVDMKHLTSEHTDFKNVTIDATCTNASYTEQRCATCGLVQESDMLTTTVGITVVDTDGNVIEDAVVEETVSVESTEEDYIATLFDVDAVKTAAATALGEEYRILTVEMPETIGWGETKTANVVVEPVEKETPVTIVVEGADVTVESVSVTSTKKGLEAAAEAAAMEAAKAAISDGVYEVTQVEANVLEWGSSAEVIVTLTEAEKETEITVKTAGADIEDQKITVKSTKAGLTAAAKAAATAAVEEKVDTEIYSYIVENAEATDLIWGTSGIVTVTVVLTENTKATPVTVTVVDENGEPVEGIEVAVEPVTSTNSSLPAMVGDAVETAAKTVLADAEYEYVSVEISDLEWGVNAKAVITVAKKAADDSTDDEIEVVEDAPEALAEEGEEGEEALPVATLNIVINGQSEQPAALTAEGEEGKVHIFTADQIEAAVEEVLGVRNQIAVTTCISDRVVKYGSERTATVALSVKEATHDYVEFKETYYTKTRDRWNTSTCYVCLNCKDTVESKPETVRTVDKNALTKVWTWRSDYSAASIYRVPTELKDIDLDCVWENPSVGSSRQVASSISKVMEGTCDEGVTYVYTATAGSDTDVKRDKQAAAPHQYIADEIQYAWAEDYSKCDISYKCSFCGKEGTYTCEGENILVDYVDPTCYVDGKTIYTALVTLEGNTYTNSQEILNDNKALGHEYAYDEEAMNDLCIRCKEVKPDSSITIPTDYRGAYTGETVTDMEELYTVEGSEGEVSLTYYTNQACTKLTAAKHGVSEAGAAPSEMGIYYVKASVAADAKYKAAESNVCKFILGPNNVTGIKKANVAAGVRLRWNKVPEATGYEIYRLNANNAYVKVKTIKNNATLEWIDENVTLGNKYTYDIRSYKNTGSSTVRSAVNENGNSIFKAKLTVSNTKKNGAYLQWTKNPEAKEYKIYRKLVGADKYTLIATVKNKANYNDKTVKNAEKYYYYVNVGGSTTPVVTKMFLNSITLKSVTVPKDKQLKVTWSKNAKADGYRIRYSTSESFKTYTTVKVTSNKTLNKTLTGLKKNTKYYIKVQSYKKSGNTTFYSGWSDVTSKKTKK